MQKAGIPMMDTYLTYALSTVTFESLTIWVVFALMSFLISYTFYRKGKLRLSSCFALALLLFYISFMLSITLFERIATPYARYELVLFWSYRLIAEGDKNSFFELFWNIVLFAPFGLLGSIVFQKRNKLPVLGSGILFSIIIELSQLFTHRGLFDFDDIIHNTVGTLIGIVACLVIGALISRVESRVDIQTS